MKVIAKKNRELALINAQNTQNENRAEIITLVVPEEYEDYNKKIVFVTDDGTVWDVITNNEYKITNAITKYKQVDFYIWLTKEVDGESIDFRTKTKTLNFYHNVDASDEITDEEIHGVNTVVNLLEEEIEKVENLNIEATKIGSTTTVTITKKDGTTESVEINDGVDGQDGRDGQDGYTPQKGVDYFTEHDIEEIETNVKNDIEESVLVNYSLIAETGAKIELSINTTDYKLKAILKDKNNNIIHTSNVIDLPLETMVVNATYDNVNKAIILTLQNGTTVEFSVADLVSGLVSESQLQTILANYYTKTEINNLLANKVDKVAGKGLSTNDFTDEYKEQVDTNTEDIEDIQDEQTEQNTDIEKLQTENARLKATLPTTGEVTGQLITLNKTAELEFIKPPLPMGNSEQVSYKGYNLYSAGNQTFVQMKNVSIEPISAGTYTISANIATTDTDSTICLFRFLKDNVEVGARNLNRGNISTNVTLTDEADTIQMFASNGFAPAEGDTATFTNIMITNTDVTDTDYEPYVGGQASPNPDYPQEITNVTGDVEVVVENKNLALNDNPQNPDANYSSSGGGTSVVQYSTQEGGYYTTNHRRRSFGILKAGSYTLSIKAKTRDGNSGFVILTEIKGYAESIMSKSSLTNNYTKYTYTFTILENKEFAVIFYNSLYWKDIQLEKGTTSTDYVEHKQQTFTFPLGNEKLMLGDYLADDGIHHVRGQVVLDGSEDWIKQWTSEGTNNVFSTPNLLSNSKRYPTATSNIICKSNYFIATHYAGGQYSIWTLRRNDNYPNLIAINDKMPTNSAGSILVKYSATTDINEFKTWLSTHNVTVEYELAEEVIVPYTSAQQEVYNQIKQAISYEEQTNISSNTIALFNVEAYQSTKLVLEERDAKYESLEARVALLE